ncbi:MAG: tetratricopeptide repeat protein [Rhizobiales bacterium]|nr:tetratricopeptide repeat protein [Hyphomicrobiales bacterium]
MAIESPLATLLSEAAALHKSGALADAAARYQEIVRADPSQADAFYGLAQICCEQGRFADGVALMRRALAVEPRRARYHVLLGRALAALGEPQEGLASFDRAVACDGHHAGAHGNRGDLLAQLGRLDEAVESYRRAIALEPGSLANWCNLGAAQAELGRRDEALASYERVLAIEPGFAEVHVIRGNLLALLGRGSDALASLEQGLALSPDHVGALVSRGDVLRVLDRHQEALASYDRALALSPMEVPALRGRAAALVALKRPDEALANLDTALAHAPPGAETLSNRGFLLLSLGRHDEALASLDRALATEPDHVEALVNRAVLLSEFGRHADAIASYDRALAVSPTHVKAHCNRAKTLFSLGRHNEALVSAEHALAIDPDHVESLYTRGMVLGRLHRYDEAIAAFERVLKLAPVHPHALSQLAVSYLAICAWDRCTAVARRLYEAMAAGTAVVAPHILLQLAAPPEVTLAGARRYVEREIPAGPPLGAAPPAAPAQSDKIRVAYLSADFRIHPVGYLTGELFERHDRSRFEIIGLSFGPDDKSELRSRIARSFDQFHDVRSAGDRDVAALIRRLGVDIAVDLNGHTDNARSGIFRYRVAPVQVNYLGYPGTLGADFIDYIIADEVVLPFDQQPYYVERIVHLPDCFLVNDATKAISPETPSRAQAGLPDRGFVFCCFNNAYKISAEIFGVWMRLLGQVDHSVLWLSQLDPRACDNLRAAARAAGIDPARIVFAPRKPAMADHFARQRLGDLFLDTPGYNAHTTASDALWAGLPVLTCLGSTFPGRVAASLLRAVGLPDMVTGTLGEYEALALKLAREPALLADIRRRLAHNRLTYPLFSTDRFARHIERAYETMREHARQGRGPESFAVEAIDTADR